MVLQFLQVMRKIKLRWYVEKLLLFKIGHALLKLLVLSPLPHSTIKTDDIESSSGGDEEKEDNLRKKVHIDGEGLLDVLEGKWLQIEKCIFTPPDRSFLVEGKRLNDHHINLEDSLSHNQDY